jgi:hypothetical protein
LYIDRKKSVDDIALAAEKLGKNENDAPITNKRIKLVFKNQAFVSENVPLKRKAGEIQVIFFCLIGIL